MVPGFIANFQSQAKGEPAPTAASPASGRP